MYRSWWMPPVMENWEQVAKMAHKLKSTIDSMGIRSIHDVDPNDQKCNAKTRDQLEPYTGCWLKQVETSRCIDACHNYS